MPIINLTNPLNVVLCVIFVLICLTIGYFRKKTMVPAISLFLCIGLLIMHTAQVFIFTDNYNSQETTILSSMLVDFGLMLVAYFGYLWIDEIEAKNSNKKSIDHSMDWLFKKV